MTVPPVDITTVKQRRLYVGWQDPASGAIEPVAALIQVGVPEQRASYLFYYLRRVTKLANFEPFIAFPDKRKLYSAERLFAFFANRLWPRKRDDYGRMMEILDLSAEADPFEVLARSGGHRATDQLEVFPEPERDPGTGMGTCLFFLRGLRHVPGSEAAAADMRVGMPLRPLLDIQNPVNRQAVLLIDESNRLLGYLPDYLTSHVHEMLQRCDDDTIRFSVEHVNSADTPRHMRVLCRLTTCWPDGYRPFMGDDFMPLGNDIDVLDSSSSSGWWPANMLLDSSTDELRLPE